MVPEWSFWLALGVMLIGLIGALLPAMPGAALIWLAALVYGLSDGFHNLTPLAFVAITLLGVIGVTTDIWMGHAMGRLGGASWQALLVGTVLGLVGMIAGLFMAGIGVVPGAIIGTLGGIVLVEWRRRREWIAAGKAGAGWLIGYILSAVVEFLVGITMIGVFVWQAAGH